MVDGELVGHTPIGVRCLPQALNVLIPKTGNNEPEKPHEKLAGLPNLKIN